MKKTPEKLLLRVLSCLLFTSAASISAQPGTSEASGTQPFETRCGWFSNPTPANASLYDSDAEWILGIQGGYQADGDWPDFGPKQWVETNVHYGYGCACLQLRVNGQTHEVIAIKKARARSLAICRRDRSLRRWGFK